MRKKRPHFGWQRQKNFHSVYVSVGFACTLERKVELLQVLLGSGPAADLIIQVGRGTKPIEDEHNLGAINNADLDLAADSAVSAGRIGAATSSPARWRSVSITRSSSPPRATACRASSSRIAVWWGWIPGIPSG